MGLLDWKAEREEILALLAEREMTGHELVIFSKHLTRGSVYVILNKMEDEGLIVSRVIEHTGPLAGKRIYALTKPQ